MIIFLWALSILCVIICSIAIIWYSSNEKELYFTTEKNQLKEGYESEIKTLSDKITPLCEKINLLTNENMNLAECADLLGIHCKKLGDQHKALGERYTESQNRFEDICQHLEKENMMLRQRIFGIISYLEKVETSLDKQVIQTLATVRIDLENLVNKDPEDVEIEEEEEV